MMKPSTTSSGSSSSGSSNYVPSHYDPSAGPRNFKMFLGSIGVLALIAVIAICADEYPKWNKKRLSEKMESAILEVSHDRVTEYSDYSKLTDWPQSIQDIYKKEQDESLLAIVEKGPENFKDYPANQKFEAGVQAWFRISGKGTEAYPYLTSLQEQPHKRMSPFLRAGSLSLYFLKDQCKKGIAMACTDAAKVRASLLFNGMKGYDEAIVDKMALDELPSDGPLSKDPAIVALREKLSQPLPDTGARHVVKELKEAGV